MSVLDTDKETINGYVCNELLSPGRCGIAGGTVDGRHVYFVACPKKDTTMHLMVEINYD